MQAIAVRKGLQASTFPHREIPHRTIGAQQHILATRHAVDACLERLGGQIERATGMAGVTTRAGLVAVIVEAPCLAGTMFGIREIMECVTNRAPSA